MAINKEKSNVIHFRRNSNYRAENIFTCGGKQLKVVDRYKYIGLLMTEHLNSEENGKTRCEIRKPRLKSLLITKYKS